MKIPQEVKSKKFWKAYLIALVIIIILGASFGFVIQLAIYKAGNAIVVMPKSEYEAALSRPSFK